MHDPTRTRFPRMRLLPRSLLALVFVLYTTTAGAQAPATGSASASDDPVLAELVRESLEVRPELRQADANVRAGRERIPQAGALPDPVVSLGIQNDGFRAIEVGRMETSFYTVMGTQAFPFFGKRGLRTDVASLEARQAEANLARVRLTVLADVRRGYLDLLLARDRLKLLSRLEELWKRSEGLARARYEAGEAAQSDILRAQLELSRLRQRRWALEAEERSRVQELNRLRARPLDDAIPTTASLRDRTDPPLPEPEAAVSDAESRSPELELARLGVARAGRLVALARRERFPDFTLSAGIMPRGGEFDPMWQAGLAFNLPVFLGRKQNRAISENEARAEADRQGAEAVGQVLRLRVNERLVALRRLNDTLRLYREGLLVQSLATADSTLAQYRVGRVTFASVLEALAGYVSDEDAYLQSVAEVQRIAVAVDEVSLDPVAAAGGGSMGGTAFPGAGGMGGAGGAAGAGRGAASAASNGSASSTASGM